MSFYTQHAELIEEVAEQATIDVDPNEPLNFYDAAKLLGATPSLADRIDEFLTIRAMKARGAI